MKKILVLVMALCLCICVTVPAVSAEGASAGGGTGGGGGGTIIPVTPGTASGNVVASGECGDDCSWNIVGDTLTITGSGAINANSYHSAPWEDYKRTIKNVIIEDGITEISQYCFRGHSAIETVQLGKDVKIIGSNAFFNCTNLTGINLPDGLLEIDFQAFSGCSKLGGVTIPQSVEKLRGDAFNYTADYNNPENWTDGIFYLGTYAVSENHDNIPEKVIIREGTTRIAGGIYLRAAKVVVIPESVNGFDTYTFHDGIIVEGVSGSGAQQSAEANRLLFFEIGKPHIKTESFGDGFSWTLDADERKLTISGSGDTGDFGYREAPWYRYNGYIDIFELESGITALGKFALEELWDIKLILPDSVTEIRCEVYGKTVICGNAGSFAESFATEKGLLFEDPDGNITVGGDLSDTVLWKFNKNKFTLTITGNGNMPDFDDYRDAPWYSFSQFIDDIVIAEGITSIGSHSFSCSSNQGTWVKVPDSVEAISDTAFEEFYILYCPADSYGAAWAENNSEYYEIYNDYDVIPVETSEELLEALGSNRKIILADGLYEISGKIGLQFIRDLVIEAEHSGYAEILSRDGYRPVMQFSCCKDISVSGLILGHTSLRYQEGACGGGESSSGYVVECSQSSDIKISGCDLYGCGTIAVMMYNAYGITLDDSILRDCKENIITNTSWYLPDRELYMETYTVINLSDCVISGNAYDDEYAKSTPALNLYKSVAEFKDCIFINNKSKTRERLKNSTVFDNCIFKDNVWQNETPSDYGVCLGGITWKVTPGENRYILQLGFPIEYGDGTVIESTKGVTVPYSQYSIPWRKFENEPFEAIELAEGVKLGGKCGDNVHWELSEEGCLTLHGSGRMSFYDYYVPWYNYYGNLIKSVVVQSGVESIARSAFSQCRNISTVTLGEGLLEIGEYAFSYGGKIGEISIPASVTSIAGNAFLSCEGLKEIKVSPESETYSSNDGVLFSKDGAVLVLYPSGKENESYTIPEGTTELGEGAFSSNYNLKSLSLPSSIAKIGAEAFWAMGGLQSITAVQGSSFATVDGVLYDKDKTKLIYYPPAKPGISFEIPSGVKELAESALEFPQNLLKLVLPDSIEVFINNFNGMNECTFVCKKGSDIYEYLTERRYRTKENDDFMVGRIRNLNVTVALPSDRAVNGYVVIAVYDWDGSLYELKKIKVTDEDDVIEHTTVKRGKHAKVMWLDMDGKLRPLSEYIEREN